MTNVAITSNGTRATGKTLPEGWRETTVGDIVDITSSKRIFHSEYLLSGVPFYRSKEIIEKQRGNDVSTQLHISEKKFNEINSKFGSPMSGDILLTSVGTLGIPYVVKSGEKFYFKDGNLTWFRNFRNLDNSFFYYWILSTSGKESLNSITIGSTQSALTIVGLKSMTINLPPLPTQRRIAAILSRLDDKTDLLRKQNKTLEAIAQTLFKRWFVEFNFPNNEGKPYKENSGKMVDSELGKMPEGWEVRKISDVGEIICGKTPSKSSPEYFGGDIPFIKIPDMHNCMFIIKTQDSLTDTGADSQKNKYIPPNSIVVSCIATVGLVSITTKTSQTNQQINTIVPDLIEYLEYLYFVLKNMTNDLQAMGSGGSATLNVNTTSFSEIEILFPSKEILNNFHKVSNPITSKISFNNSQIQTLTQLRDTLLPKLVSGELPVLTDV